MADQAGDIEAPGGRDGSTPLKKLARDVAVNVIANLIAGAIIYLFSAAIGILPRSRVAIATAVAFLAIAGVFGFVGLGLASMFHMHRVGDLRRYGPSNPIPDAKAGKLMAPMAASSISIGVLFIILPFASPDPANPIAWGAYGFGLLFILTGGGMLRRSLKHMRKPEK